MEKKIYYQPEIKVSSIVCDIITQSYVEDEEWTGPNVNVNGNTPVGGI